VKVHFSNTKGKDNDKMNMMPRIGAIKHGKQRYKAIVE